MTEAKSAQPQLPPLDEFTEVEKRDSSDWARRANRFDVQNLYLESTCRERQLLSALADNESLKAQLADVVFIYQCSHCAWIGNPEQLGKLCHACGKGTCIRFATSKNGEHSIVMFSNLAAKAEAERDKALEVIKKYRKQHTIGHFALYVCDTCKAADALLSREAKEAV